MSAAEWQDNIPDIGCKMGDKLDHRIPTEQTCAPLARPLSIFFTDNFPKWRTSDRGPVVPAYPESRPCYGACRSLRSLLPKRQALASPVCSPACSGCAAGTAGRSAFTFALRLPSHGISRCRSCFRLVLRLHFGRRIHGQGTFTPVDQRPCRAYTTASADG